MQEENNNVAGNGQSLNWWLRFIAAGITLFVILISLYTYMFIYGGWEMIVATLTPETEPENTSIAFPDLPGEILFTALVDNPEIENATNYLPIAATPNGLSAEQGMHILIDSSENASVLSIQHAFSADSTKLTFLGWPLTEDLSHPTPAIYRADVVAEVTNYEQFIQDIKTTATLVLEPDEEDYFRHMPAISSAGDILYSSLPETGFNPEPSVYSSIAAEEWTIYHLGSNNERRNLTSGLAPRWVDADSFAFLKNDGIYLYKISTGEEKLLWSLSIVPTLLSAFDVSDNGRFLAISNPVAELVTIITNIGGGESTSPEVFSEVSAKATTGLTFAADNSYLAVSLLEGTEESGTSSLVEYYSLASKSFHYKYMDLEIPNQQAFYMTDWK